MTWIIHEERFSYAYGLYRESKPFPASVAPNIVVAADRVLQRVRRPASGIIGYGR
jgi:hypothetical protein